MQQIRPEYMFRSNIKPDSFTFLQLTIQLLREKGYSCNELLDLVLSSFNMIKKVHFEVKKEFLDCED